VLEYPINDLVLMLTGLLTASNMLKFAKSPSEPIPDPEWPTKVSVALDGLHRLGGALEIDSSLMEQIASLKDDLVQKPCNVPAIVIKTQLDSIIGGIQNNLCKRTFMYVPVDQAPYWNNQELFGEDFVIGFPRVAISELVETGNCFASGRNTACVFHCMRVAEYGLRILARKVGATISNKGKTCPLEYGDWDTVITAIRNKIAETRKLPRGAKKEAALQFYSTAADQCEYMKDIWRNEISHARRRYSKSEALGVMNRVRDFVQPLAVGEAKQVIKRKVIRHKRSTTDTLANLKALMNLSPKPKP
jgi:hypothetical protein